MEEVSEKRREKKGRKVREDNGKAVIIGQFLESHRLIHVVNKISSYQICQDIPELDWCTLIRLYVQFWVK